MLTARLLTCRPLQCQGLARGLSVRQWRLRRSPFQVTFGTRSCLPDRRQRRQPSRPFWQCLLRVSWFPLWSSLMAAADWESQALPPATTPGLPLRRRSTSPHSSRRRSTPAPHDSYRISRCNIQWASRRTQRRLWTPRCFVQRSPSLVDDISEYQIDLIGASGVAVTCEGVR